MYQKLTNDDLSVLKKSRSSLLVNMLTMALIFYVIIPLVMNYILHVSLSFSWIYISISSLLLVGAAWNMSRDLNKCSKDIKAGVKFSGTTEVEKKHKITLKGTSKCWLYFQMDGEKKVEINVFDYQKITEGDEIFIEFAEKSMQVLTLRKIA